MKLFTVLCEGKEIAAVSGESGNLYGLETFGIHAADMNTLIDNWDEYAESKTRGDQCR